MRRLIGSALLLSSSFVFLTGFGEPRHSKVTTQSTVKGKSAALDFKVDVLVKTGKDALILSEEGTWTLELTNIQGLNLKTDQGKFISKEFDHKTSTFAVKADLDDKATAFKMDYKLRAFVCKVDKTQCFPEIHKGTLEWKKS